MTRALLEICVVGAGPRGLSVIERLCANERAAPSHAGVTIHVVDPSPPGAGTVWRPEQSRHLLMNTVASQITVFTDDSARLEGPIEAGPSLYEWARALVARTEAGHGEAEEDVLSEARALGPDSYPTRSFYGRYLRSCFQEVVDRAPAHVAVKVHRSRAVAIADVHGITDGTQGVRLEDGTRLNELDAIILAQGHLPTRLSAREARTAGLARIHHLTYVAPANPADLDLTGVKPGQPVLLRGLGLNFFDHMALFSVGRGGTFERGEDGKLVYHASGREPKMYAFSRRGVPYHSRGENQKGAYGRYFPRLLTVEYIEKLRARSAEGQQIRFKTDLWPLISREVESVYYETLLTARDRAADGAELADRYLKRPVDDDGAQLLTEFGIQPEDHWSWDRLSRPYESREFTSRESFRSWLLEYLAADVIAARSGNVSGPVKAALDVLRDLRNEIRLAVDHGGLAGDSYRDELEGWYTPLNAFLSIGPPASRIEEMIALIECGLLEVTGPGTKIAVDTAAPQFVAVSTDVPGPPIHSTVLIEARLPEPDLRRTDDPLMRHLLDTGQAQPYSMAGSQGRSYQTGGLAVTERPYRLLDGNGQAHPRRFAYGVPTESVHWVTAAGIRPGVDSVTLGDSDAIARAALAVTPVANRPWSAQPQASEEGLVGVIV